MCFGLVVLLFFVVLVEFAWFYFVLQKVPASDAADLIVVFGGACGRTEKGYALANKGMAPFMIVSPAPAKRLNRLDKTYRLKAQYHYLIEDRAETTFQNALLVAEMARRRGVRSALLVTSDYHMPRSWFLFKLQLAGSGVAVRPWPVEVGRFSCNPLAWSSMQKKRVYNEMVGLWGSVAEMMHNCVTGQLPEKGLKRNKVVSRLRSILLFDISDK
jgi:hypothetical protein